MVHISTTSIASREDLDQFLSDLNCEHGLGEVSVVDCTGAPFLLAAYESMEDCLWDAFGSHPYSDESAPDGLAEQVDLMEEVDVDSLAGFGFEPGQTTLLALSSKVAHPGLDQLRYPLTAFVSTLTPPRLPTPRVTDMAPGTRLTVQMRGSTERLSVVVRQSVLLMVEGGTSLPFYIRRDDIDESTIRDIVEPASRTSA